VVAGDAAHRIAGVDDRAGRAGDVRVVEVAVSVRMTTQSASPTASRTGSDTRSSPSSFTSGTYGSLYDSLAPRPWRSFMTAIAGDSRQSLTPRL
jgi:hypothetical protein